MIIRCLLQIVIIFALVVHKADDRLAALVANTDGEGCIFFNNKKTDMNSTYDIWFMKKDGEWKVIR